MAVIQVTDVSFRYRRAAPWVLRRLHAEFDAGQVIRLSGANGAGKSTLLRLLAGMLVPVRGAIIPRPALVGYAPERFPARQPFSVRRYLDHLAAMRGVDAAVRDHEISNRLDLLNLTNFADERLGNLSKGTAQKVGLAQATLGQPQLLLLDEPWSGLDRDARNVVPTLVREVADRGGTVIYADHEQRAGELDTDAHWRLRDGSLVVSVGSKPEDPFAVLQVEVPRADADKLRSELRDRGYRVGELP